MYKFAKCENCGKKYKDNRNVDQKLLDAIFGQRNLCQECLKDLTLEKCSKCGKFVENPIWFGDEPYHPSCLPYSEEVGDMRDELEKNF